MNDSESELPGVNIEAIFPHHIARVRSEMDKDRAEEYVRKGNKLLNGLIWTFVTAVLLFSHTLAENAHKEYVNGNYRNKEKGNHRTFVNNQANVYEHRRKVWQNALQNLVEQGFDGGNIV